MADEISGLLALTQVLMGQTRLEDILQTIADRCATLLRTPRVSIRLFDPTQTRLLATCRAGQPLHQNATGEYRRGEGLVGWISEQAQPLRSDDAEADPRFVTRPDMVDRMGSFLGAPVMVDRACIGVISAVNVAKAYFTPHDEQVLQLVAGLCSPHIEVARLLRLAHLDPLTGAFNRRGLDLVYPPSDRQVSLIMVDIDHFKAINDRCGHAAGDEVLRRVARLLSEGLRAEDSVVRLGGEEFLLVLPELDLHTAARIADRTRALVEQTRLAVTGAEVQLTVSAGVARVRPAETRDAAIARADAALYRAKTEGRNRVVLADA